MNNLVQDLAQFAGLNSVSEIKACYRKLVMIYHPDHGGNANDFRTLQAIYEAAIQSASSQSASSQSASSQSASSQSASSQSASSQSASSQSASSQSADTNQFTDLIAQVKALNLQGIIIDPIGSWLWVKNTRREHYEPLKALGFSWSRKRKAMYFAENLGPKRKYASKLSDEELKRKYSYRNY